LFCRLGVDNYEDKKKYSIWRISKSKDKGFKKIRQL
jgi:hypothetical protein